MVTQGIGDPAHALAAQQAQDPVAQRGQSLRSLPSAHLPPIFAHRLVSHVMHLVLNPPMPASVGSCVIARVSCWAHSGTFLIVLGARVFLPSPVQRLAKSKPRVNRKKAGGGGDVLVLADVLEVEAGCYPRQAVVARLDLGCRLRKERLAVHAACLRSSFRFQSSATRPASAFPDAPAAAPCLPGSGEVCE